MEKTLLTAAIAGLLALAAYYLIAQRFSFLDYPNHRSSHSRPTISGAGLPLAVVFALFIAVLSSQGVLSGEQFMTYLLVSLIAIPGWLDDRYQLSVGLRLLLFALLAVGVAVSLRLEAVLPIALASIFLLGFLNAFNFMDGIDGLAASQAVFVLLALSVFTMVKGDPAGLLPVLLLAASLVLVFLCWNWAPARLFLGDAGSIFLGLLLATLVLHSAVAGVIEYASGLALLSVLLADSGVTLLTRILNGEAFYKAHRTHVYQLLAIRFNSHARVSALYLLISGLLVLPVVVLIEHWPGWQWSIFAIWGLFLTGVVHISRSQGLRFQARDI